MRRLKIVKPVNIKFIAQISSISYKSHASLSIVQQGRGERLLSCFLSHIDLAPKYIPCGAPWPPLFEATDRPELHCKRKNPSYQPKHRGQKRHPMVE